MPTHTAIDDRKVRRKNASGCPKVDCPKVNSRRHSPDERTTRTRINYFMNKFRKLGLVEYNGELRVHSSLLNVIVRD